MNDFIQIYKAEQSQFKYKAPFDGWKPVYNKIGTIRINLAGNIDAAYATKNLKVWEGRLRAHNMPESGFGSPQNLLDTLTYNGPITFVDHKGISHTVHFAGEIDEKSFSPDWYGNSNFIDIKVKLLEAS